MAKVDTYELCTQRLIDALMTARENPEGVPAWRKPWTDTVIKYETESVTISGSSGLQHNACSGWAYGGINPFLLASCGFSTAQWGTFKQWKAVAEASLKRRGYVLTAQYDKVAFMAETGYVPKENKAGEEVFPKYVFMWPDTTTTGPEGMFPCAGVRRHETSTPVFLWKPFRAKKKDSEGNVVRDDNGKPVMEKRLLLKHFYVFNRDQVGGVVDSDLKAPKPMTITIRRPAVVAKGLDGLPEEWERAFPAAFAVLNAYYSREGAPPLTRAGNRAFYAYSDKVTIPDFPAFQAQADTEEQAAASFFATLFHETVHSTGHASRCARTFGRRFGDLEYAMEELVAEFGSAQCCAMLGLPSRMMEDHIPYLSTWIEKLLAQADTAKWTPHTMNKESRRALECIGVLSARSADDESGSASETVASNDDAANAA